MLREVEGVLSAQQLVVLVLLVLLVIIGAIVIILLNLQGATRTQGQRRGEKDRGRDTN